MGFSQSRADTDVWMQKDANVYKCIAVYTDNLAIASRDPKKITDALECQHGFKL